NSIGIHSRGWARDRFIYDNATVEGFGTGMVIPKQGTITVNCGSFNNQTNFEIPMAVQDFRDVLFDGMTTGSHPSFQSANYTEIVMTADFSLPIDKHPLYFMLPDRIILNYGDYANQRLYYDQQAASFIPITAGSEQSDEGQIIQSRFVNLSNQELQDTYQMSFGGDLLPDQAVSVDGIIGGKISAITSSSQNMPTCVNFDSEGRFLKVSNFPDIDECIGTQSNLVGSVLSPFAHAACTFSTSCDDGAIPTAPSTVTATGDGCTAINIVWSSSTCAVDYAIERSTDGGSTWTALSTNTTATSFTDSSLMADVTHQYRVKAQNNELNSAYTISNAITCSTATNTFPSDAKIMPFGASRTEGGAEFESHRYELWKGMLDNGWVFDYIGNNFDDKNYSDHLGQAFDRNHAGYGGATSEVLLENLPNELSDAGIPDIVLFSAPGGNDALGFDTFDAITTFANINAIIDAFQEANANVTIFIEQPAPVGEVEGAQAKTNLDLIAEEIPNIALQQSTATSSIVPVDLNSDWSDDWFAGDGDVVHYNEAGAIEVANRYLGVMNIFYAEQLLPTQYTLTTTATTGGSVTTGGVYNAGTAIQITATSDEGYEFSGWSGDANGSDNPLTVTIDNNKSITASFSLVLSIGQGDIRESVKCYPNPSSDIFNIEVDMMNYDLMAFSIDGRIVGRWERLNRHFRLDATAWNKGVYVLQIIDRINTRKHSIKIIKN
ncbi:MAG: GDSL-type esterase/lipase family protein, partial [Bacteroidota bacterium]